ALLEERVDYKGGNGLPIYHHVLRAFPGGAEGVVVKNRLAKQSVEVDLAAVRAELKKYLKESTFANKELPFDLNRMSVVAFLQDDASKEVLHAVRAAVEPGSAP